MPEENMQTAHRNTSTEFTTQDHLVEALTVPTCKNKDVEVRFRSDKDGQD